MKAQILNILNQISEITHYIMDLYELLIRLETENKKGSMAYKHLLDLLYLAVEAEKGLYASFESNVEMAVEAARFLFNKHTTSPIIPTEMLLIKHDKTQMIRSRICRNFSRIINANPNYFVVGKVDHLMESVDENDRAITYSYLYDQIPLLESSTNIRLAGFIEEDLKSSDPFIKRFMIKGKYCLSFLDSQLENVYLKNSFTNVPNAFSLEIATPYEEDVIDEFKNYIKNNHGQSLVFIAANKLEEYTSQSIRPKDYTEIMIFSNLLRVGLLYLSEEARAVLHAEICESEPDEDTSYRKMIDFIFHSAKETYAKVNKDLNQQYNFE